MRGGQGAAAKLNSLTRVLCWLRDPADSPMGQEAGLDLFAAIDDVSDDFVAAFDNVNEDTAGLPTAEQVHALPAGAT